MEKRHQEIDTEEVGSRVSELIYDRQSVGQSVLASGAHLGLVTNFSLAMKFLFRHLRFCKFVAPSLARGRVCKVLYNCFWALPEQSLLRRSPQELTVFFYCRIRDSTNLEGQVPVFRSHVSAVRNFQNYYWEGCMGSMQCNVEFGCQICM
jgi:hypothetical protein